MNNRIIALIVYIALSAELRASFGNEGIALSQYKSQQSQELELIPNPHVVKCLGKPMTPVNQNTGAPMQGFPQQPAIDAAPDEEYIATDWRDTIDPQDYKGYWIDLPCFGEEHFSTLTEYYEYCERYRQQVTKQESAVVRDDNNSMSLSEFVNRLPCPGDVYMRKYKSQFRVDWLGLKELAAQERADFDRVMDRISRSGSLCDEVNFFNYLCSKSYE